MTMQRVMTKADVTFPCSILKIISVNRGPGWNAVPFVQATAFVQPKEIYVSEEEKKLMARYGITSTSKMIYSYKQHRYERITDALRYAESDFISAQKSTTSNSR